MNRGEAAQPVWHRACFSSERAGFSLFIEKRVDEGLFIVHPEVAI
jgi:hypothetical protein